MDQNSAQSTDPQQNQTAQTAPVTPAAASVTPPSPEPAAPVVPQPEPVQTVQPQPNVDVSAGQTPTPVTSTAEPAGPPPIVFPQEQPQPAPPQPVPAPAAIPTVPPVVSAPQDPQPLTPQPETPAPTPEPTPAPEPVQPAPPAPQPEAVQSVAPTPATPASQPEVVSAASTAPTQPGVATGAPTTESLHATMPNDHSHPEEEHHSGLAKVFTILLVVILLAGIGFAAYAVGASKYLPFHTSNTAEVTQAVQKIVPTATPTPDPTASWLTYSNAKYTYSLKYPTGLTPNEVNTYYHYVEFKNATVSGTLPPYLVSVIPASFTAKNLAGYNFMSADFISALETLRTGEIATNSGSTFTKISNSTAGGMDAFTVNVAATGIKQERTYVKTNNYIYMLSTNYKNQSDLDTFNLLLSTFKVTK